MRYGKSSYNSEFGRATKFCQGWAKECYVLAFFCILFKRTQCLTFFCVLYKKNAAFFAFFYVLYKRMLRSLCSFTFFIKECGFLCILLRSLYISIYIYIFIYNIYLYICIKKNTGLGMRSFQKNATFCILLRSFAKECCVLCVLLRCLQKNIAFFPFFYILKKRTQKNASFFWVS